MDGEKGLCLMDRIWIVNEILNILAASIDIDKAIMEAHTNQAATQNPAIHQGKSIEQRRM